MPVRWIFSDYVLIPACAGKTIHGPDATLCKRAHPCLRGENLSLSQPSESSAGSSLLARGKLAPPQAHSIPLESSLLARGKHLPTSPWLLYGRIIPACAGKTAYHATPVSRVGDHPCSRGENFSYGGDAGQTAGSSPLARGKPPISWVARVLIRIIPACAGKTECSYCTGDCQ